MSIEPEHMLKLAPQIYRAISLGKTTFLCGGARGWDTYTALTVAAIKSNNSLIKLVLVLPCCKTEHTKYWGNTPTLSLFEKTLQDFDILYHRIRVATPRHNGKVERQHRIDESRFYKKMRMYSLADGRAQLLKYNKKSNGIPKICLNFLSPNEVLEKYLGVM